MFGGKGRVPRDWRLVGGVTSEASVELSHHAINGSRPCYKYFWELRAGSGGRQAPRDEWGMYRAYLRVSEHDARDVTRPGKYFVPFFIVKVPRPRKN